MQSCINDNRCLKMAMVITFLLGCGFYNVAIAHHSEIGCHGDRVGNPCEVVTSGK